MESSCNGSEVASLQASHGGGYGVEQLPTHTHTHTPTPEELKDKLRKVMHFKTDRTEVCVCLGGGGEGGRRRGVL